MKRPNCSAFVVCDVRKTGSGSALHTAPNTVTFWSTCRLRLTTAVSRPIHVRPGFAVAWKVDSSA